MSLPNLNVFNFEITLPTTKQKVKLRPYLVGEQKVLLMAQHSQDEEDIFEAIKTIISNCIVEPKLDVDNMPLYDIEYIFLNLRTRSVGGGILLTYPCSLEECQGVYKHVVNIDKLTVPVDPNFSNVVKVTDSLSMTFKVPSYKILKELLVNKDQEKDEIEQLISLAFKCTVNVFDETNVYEDFTEEEFRDFILGFTNEQFQKVSAFFDGLPKIHYEIPFKCPKCNDEETIVVETLADFFE